MKRKIIIHTFFGKSTMLAFALLYALLITIGSTFSWVTSSAQKVNEFSGEMGLKAVIVEDFEQQINWQPGTDITKTVSVYNDGKSEGFVRISFEEIVDQITSSSVSEPYADPEEEGVTPEYCMVSEWEAWQNASDVTEISTVLFLEGSLPAELPEGVTVKVYASPAGIHRYKYAIYQEINDGEAYRRMSAQFSLSGNVLTVLNPRFWGYQETTGRSEAAWGLLNETAAVVQPPDKEDIGYLVCDPGQKITINYSHVITELTGVTEDGGKWYYNSDDGFFYYIGKIGGGEMSNTLMTSLSLADDANIAYSKMELELIVNMQALQMSTDALAADWGLSGQLYNILASFCQ